MVRLFINAGKRNKIRAKDIVGAFSGETNVPGDVIGEIDLYDDFVYVDVPYEYAKDIIEGMRNKKIKGKRIIVEKAKKPKFKNKKIKINPEFIKINEPCRIYISSFIYASYLILIFTYLIFRSEHIIYFLPVYILNMLLFCYLLSEKLFKSFAYNT